MAGFANVAVLFIGGFVDGQLVGELTMGAEGRLPGGEAITYTLSGTRVPQFSAGDLFDLGVDEYNQENYQEALDWYQQSAQADPTFAPAYYGIGAANYVLGNDEAALEAMQTFLELADGEDQFTAEAQRVIDELRGE